MTKPFNMAMFLSGVLTGSEVTRQRHLRQARIMQAAIQQRWQRDNPWTWQLKHVRWFFTQHLRDHSDATRYYYRLTTLLILKRLGNNREMLIQRSNRGWAVAPKSGYQVQSGIPESLYQRLPKRLTPLSTSER